MRVPVQSQVLLYHTRTTLAMFGRMTDSKKMRRHLDLRSETMELVFDHSLKAYSFFDHLKELKLLEEIRNAAEVA